MDELIKNKEMRQHFQVVAVISRGEPTRFYSEIDSKKHNDLEQEIDATSKRASYSYIIMCHGETLQKYRLKDDCVYVVHWSRPGAKKPLIEFWDWFHATGNKLGAEYSRSTLANGLSTPFRDVCLNSR